MCLAEDTQVLTCRKFGAHYRRQGFLLTDHDQFALQSSIPDKVQTSCSPTIGADQRPATQNAEFIRTMMAVEAGESSHILPPGSPINGLLEKVTAQDRSGRTALHWLATRGHAKCLNMIMERLNTEDDAIITDHDGRTAIHEAVIQNNIAVLDEFLKHEMARRAIDRIDRTGRYKRTALHWAAIGGRDDILQKLIDGGANLELTEECGQTALRVAASRKNSESQWIILLALIAKGAGNNVIEELIRKDQISPHETGREGETLLHHAVMKGHQAIARTLIRIGSFDLDAMDKYGSTPLAYACQFGNDPMAKLLIDAGADPNARRRVEDGTILIKAAFRGDVTIVNRLIGAKAEVDARNSQGDTALLLAALSGHVNVVKALLESGANIDVKTVRGFSPLGMAASKGHEPVVRLLLENKAEVNTVNKQGRSPLSFAAGSGFKGCVDLLLDAGAVVDMRDESGTTPCLWAIRNKHGNIADVLFQMENQATDNEDENNSEGPPSSESDNDDGWPRWLADTAGQDNSRSRWQKTNLPQSFKMTSLL